MYLVYDIWIHIVFFLLTHKPLSNNCYIKWVITIFFTFCWLKFYYSILKLIIIHKEVHWSISHIRGVSKFCAYKLLARNSFMLIVLRKDVFKNYQFDRQSTRRSLVGMIRWAKSNLLNGNNLELSTRKHKRNKL